jgi:hypothetical protein
MIEVPTCSSGFLPVSILTYLKTDGDPTDTLLQHQSRQPRSQFPSQERLRPYSIPSSRAASRRTSKASTSIYDFNDDAERPERARRGSKLELKLTDMRYYSELDQKNIKHARKLIILDMLLESGWKKTSELELVAAECISQASAASGHGMSILWSSSYYLSVLTPSRSHEFYRRHQQTYLRWAIHHQRKARQ